MRMRRSLLWALAIVLLSSIAAEAEEESSNNPKYNDEGDSDKKISATLNIDDDGAKNGNDKALAAMVNQQEAGEEARLLIVNGSRENATRELALPNNENIHKIISDDPSGEEEVPEELPEAQELKFIRPGPRRRPYYKPPSPPPRRPSSLNRRNVYSDPLRTSIRPPRRPTEVKRGPTEKECIFFTNTVCLEALNYPHEAIRRSLRNNKEMASALLSDYKVQDFTGSSEDFSSPVLSLENRFESRYENRYENNEIKRRSDLQSPLENVEEGFTCPSVVKYARPQLARAASGIWKYIINTGEHTQTLRLEKCLNTQSSCSFISENYRSSCVQVYNYHRLLTWDSKLGLHMDIFKVPTCCSCHVHGYAEIYPPHEKDPPSKPKESFPGAEFATTEQKDDFDELNRPTSNYINKYSPGSSYDATLVSSNKKPVVEVSPSRPPFTLPGRNRPKKPSSMPRPFDKLPQQHAPNTRAPGYKGPVIKNTRQTNRPNRPFRRESTAEDIKENPSNASIGNRYSQPYDLDIDTASRLENGGFDEEYPEPHKRINYNYHPIIDFFKPEASMLQSAESQISAQQTVQSDSNSWKPMLTS